ncbi:epoxide hydrolase 4 [Patella vulgata]|uniref:epoxide hydrolase 4 n=1 Tax=Patella vulgata TaxID=6465 RepID=UPI002180610F|nr:epoxide hydrolase 4 [Patella vulgata]
MSVLSHHYVRVILSYIIGLFIATVVSIRALWYIIRNADKAFYNKDRIEMPPCLTDESLGTHRYIHLEKVRLHYVVNGEEGKPLMLLLHGFPEFWYSWRHQLREFSKDYRVVAVDQRGYSDSDKPSGINSYKIANMVDDVKQLIPALGYRSCVLVGHDWGGAISWLFAAKYPDMVDKLIIMNCPHPTVFQKYMSSHLAQFKKSWYMFLFLIPFVPEFYFRMTDYKMLNGTFRSTRMGVVDKSKMTDEDMEAYKYAFSRPGSDTGSINYIRAMFHNKTTRADFQKITSPTLLIWGCQDGALEKGMAPLAQPLVENLKIEYIEDASHWVQMDRPDRVNKLIRQFLAADN